jgi:lipoyl(octanoyl) transferase
MSVQNDDQFQSWRVILDPPARGSWNMAVDDALIESAQQPGFTPTLRLYSWVPACLSLGHAQSIQEVDQSLLRSFGWDLVRRPTGGRAILHTDELTYSITANNDHPLMNGGILESYHRISQAFLYFLQIYSLAPVSRAENHAGNKQPEPVCFEVPSNYEITVSGKKIIGSAQARRKSAVLQHGAIPLFGDITRITHVLSYPSEDARQIAADKLKMRATTIESETGIALSWDQAAHDLIHAFEVTHQMRFTPGQLTPREIETAGQIQSEKYAVASWTERT